jgi:hypothetical protein
VTKPEPLCGDPTCESPGCTQEAIDAYLQRQQDAAREYFESLARPEEKQQ